MKIRGRTMKRDEQIEFLAKAQERAQTRAAEWHADPKVKAAAKADHSLTLALIREAKKRKSNA